MPKSIHIEGIPGSGKTTASQILCQLLQSRGIDAQWWLEESGTHPIMTKKLRAQSSSANFSELSLDAWRTFLATSNKLAVLDGYAFQSTVRFLFANLLSRQQIEEYFEKWQQLEPDTSMIFFAVDNPTSHFDSVLEERGSEWAAKLFSYVAHTPYGRANSLNGTQGFIDFWSRYQDLCLELIDHAQIRVDTIRSRSWSVADN